jgi:hypothetical protein
MKKILLFALLSFSVFSCQKHELANPELSSTTACGVTNPLKELPWLKAEVDKAAAVSDYCTLWQVTQGEYAGKTVYIVVVSGALCCTCGNMVYDCEGEVVLACDAAEEGNIANKKVIWKRQ